MMTHRATLLLLLLLCAASVGFTSALLRVPPRFTVDLSLPPDRRYQGAVAAILKEHHWNVSFGPAFRAHNATLFDHLNSDQYQVLVNATRTFHPEVFAELQGISADFRSAGHDVTVAYLVAWQWFHELAHTELSTANLHSERACTAAVVQDSAGRIIHGRNMDQSPPAVRNVTMQFNYIYNGVDQNVQSVDWYWFAGGFMTAVKRGVGSVQENWRFDTITSESVFQAAAAGVTPQLLAFKYALLGRQDVTNSTAAGNFGDLSERLCYMDLAAPDYVVVAGTSSDQGIVCARGTGTEVAWKLSLADVATSRQASWPYLIQTNYDSCFGEPATDPRCTSASQIMESMGQDIGSQDLGLMATMTEAPVRNGDTAYTAIMCAAEGTMTSFAWVE